MKSHDEPIPKRRGKKAEEKPKRDQDNAYLSEYGRIYGIERLNVEKVAHCLENDFE